MVSIFRRTRRGAAFAALTISLALPALAAVATSEASAEIPAASGPADSSAEAAQRAQASGEAVEDLSQRSETTRVFANPDGTWRQETFADPVRVEDADGDWHNLDTRLVPSGEGFAPKYALIDVVISGGGDSEFATLTEDGHTVAFSWGDDLPEPVIDGDTATYEDVAPGQDLVVKALPGGFEHSLVLHEQPEGDVDFTTGVSVDGAKIAETSDGGAVVKAVNGDVVATIEQPVVYDSDDASRPVPAEAELTGTPASGQELTVTAKEEYLSDPGTEYPVTIDPVVQVFTSGDTWIQNNSTTNQGTNPELRVGTNNSGSTIARAYIDFPDQNWSGKQIQSADLVMYNTYSATCTSLAINASRITQPWGFTTISWPGPTAGANTAGFSTAYGAPSGSCGGGGYTHFNVTGIVNAWNSGQPNYGIRLMASNEQSNNSFRKYYSANYTSAPTSRPHINATYVLKPTVTQLSVSPCVSECSTWPLVSTTTPTLSVKTSEATGSAYSLAWRVFDAETGTTVATKSESISASGTGSAQETTSTWAIPANVLSDDHLYGWTATATGPSGSGSASSEFELVVGYVDTNGETTDAEVAGEFVEDAFDAGAEAPPSEVDEVEEISALTDDEVRNDDLEGQQQVQRMQIEMSRAAASYDPEPPIGGKKIPRAGWAACGNFDSRFKVAKDYYRKNLAGRQSGSYALLYCGRTDTLYHSDGSLKESKFGYWHILDKHLYDYQATAWAMGRSWRDIAGWMIAWTLYDPDRVSQAPTRFCYERKFKYYNAQHEKVFEGRNVVILGVTGVRIMTAFPRYTGSYCNGQNNTGPTIYSG